MFPDKRAKDATGGLVAILVIVCCVVKRLFAMQGFAASWFETQIPDNGGDSIVWTIIELASFNKVVNAYDMHHYGFLLTLSWQYNKHHTKLTYRDIYERALFIPSTLSDTE